MESGALIKLFQGKMKTIVDHGVKEEEKLPVESKEMKETFIPQPEPFAWKFSFTSHAFRCFIIVFVLLQGFSTLKEEETPCRQYKWL